MGDGSVNGGGLEAAEVLPPGEPSVMCGRWLGARTDRPTIMIYGHFEVQFSEQFDLWDNPPSKSEVRD